MRLLHYTILSLVFVTFISLATANARCVYLQPVNIKIMEVGNMLSWSTYKEVDNKFFVIEKSVDGITFKKVGDVKGAGNSNTIRTYRFLDFALGERKIFYRLLHYTSDGSYTISETFIVEKNTQNNLMITSMSSTVTDKKLSLTIRSSVDARVSFVFKNYKGKVIARGKKKIAKGLNALSFNCSKLPVGRYELTLIGNNEKEKITIRKVKSSEMPRIDYEVKK
ncbi:MAG TPA: hypothetical protein ENJ53_10960 [Phaeodactylibacter sp.]|nr:hypothetical protein [Phaeodactylibacter sp.]